MKGYQLWEVSAFEQDWHYHCHDHYHRVNGFEKTERNWSSVGWVMMYAEQILENKKAKKTRKSIIGTINYEAFRSDFKKKLKPKQLQNFEETILMESKHHQLLIGIWYHHHHINQIISDTVSMTNRNLILSSSSHKSNYIRHCF